MDVRTGTFLFTAQVHVNARERTTPFATGAKLRALKHRANTRAVRRLAREVVAQCRMIRQEATRQRAELRGAGRAGPRG